jgi:hypothetical protein
MTSINEINVNEINVNEINVNEINVNAPSVIVGDNEAPIEVNFIPHEKKLYRCASYDDYDKTYAATVCPLAESRAAFNKFTDNLLDEPCINRYKMLDAIHDYNNAGHGFDYPLGLAFENAAFNCRPYNSCTIS